jgi:hypothetical protein
MATRTLNRRALRDRQDSAEQDEPERDVDESEDDADEDAPKPRARKKAAKVKAPAKAKTPAKPRARKKDKAPQRMVARWAVFDNAAKRVAVFEYKDRAGADAKLAEVRERKAGTYYLQLVKDPYDPPTESAGSV